MSGGSRGTPRGRPGRVVADEDLPAFKARIDDLHIVQGLSLRLVSERLGISVSTITHRLARLKKLESSPELAADIREKVKLAERRAAVGRGK